MTHLETLCKEYKHYKRIQEEAKERQEEIKNLILELLGDEESLTIGEYKASFKTVNVNSFETSKAFYRTLKGDEHRADQKHRRIEKPIH